MNKILYLTQTVINGRMLQNILTKEIVVEIKGMGYADDIEEYDLIIVDFESEVAICSAEVSRLRAKCGFKDIPILVAALEKQLSSARKMLSIGATDLIRKPYYKKQTMAVIDKALKPTGVKTKIDMKVVTPFIESGVDVIKTMTKAEVIRRELYLKRNYNLFGDVSGVMGITGDTEGVVAITFHQDLAFDMVSRMVGCAESDLAAEDVYDGIGEIINMISGNAKNALGDSKFSFNISLPTIIMGHGHQIAHQRNLPVVVIIFEADSKPFAMTLCIATGKDYDEKQNAEMEKQDVVT